MNSNLLIVGLGNPGGRYAETRHNAGRLVLDRFAEQLSAGPISSGPVSAGSGSRICLEWKVKFKGRYALLPTDQLVSGSYVYEVAHKTLGEKYSRNGGEAGYERIILLHPETYMNESGRSIAPLAKFFKVAPESICVVHDELDLPLGRLSYKSGGGHGGHNGLRSTIDSLGSNRFLRLRVGIGRPKIASEADKGGDLVHSWVLGKFSAEERPDLMTVVNRGSEALALIVALGFVRAQMETNKG